MAVPMNGLAFTFPGQGSQTAGMLDALAAHYPIVEQLFARASRVLDKDLWAIASKDPGNQLGQTQNTQPVMLTAGYAVWEVWKSLGGRIPDWLAGHSLGEYTALVCAEAIRFEDAVQLVAKRAELMQTAVPEGVGAMAAILGLEDQQVVKLCEDAAQGEIVAAVNFNTKGQVVIAGHAAAVQRTMDGAKAAGAKRALPLPISVPSHCDLMRPAAEKFSQFLAGIEISTPTIKLIHNVDVDSHDTPGVIRTILEAQLYRPVRWVEIIQSMHAKGVTCFVECGPGKVLLGLNKRIVQADHYAIYDSATLNTLLELQR